MKNREEEILKLIGPRITALRKAKNLSQQDVADFLGVQRPTYSKIENGHIIPIIKHILKLSKLFKVSVEYFITGQKTKINLPDFGEMTHKVTEMLIHMGKSEPFLHGMLSHYYSKKFEYSLYEHEK